MLMCQCQLALELLFSNYIRDKMWFLISLKWQNILPLIFKIDFFIFLFFFGGGEGFAIANFPVKMILPPCNQIKQPVILTFFFFKEKKKRRACNFLHFQASSRRGPLF
jgi:hypothetical protein